MCVPFEKIEFEPGKRKRMIRDAERGFGSVDFSVLVHIST